MITLKEIAKLSGVSITTVSKIINNKAGDISQDTIDRVLEVVKKHNYRPYGVTRKETTSKSLTIAVLLRNMDYTNSLIEGLLEVLTDSGYSLLLYNSKDNIDLELQNIHKIHSKDIDGILWQPVSDKSLKNARILEETTSNIIYLDALLDVDGLNYFIDFRKLGYFATKELINRGHSNIACIIKNHDSVRSQLVIEGFRECLFNNNIPFKDDMIISYSEYNYENFKTNNYSALISSHFFVAKELYDNFRINEVDIPSDMSMISLYYDERNSVDINNISSIRIPKYDFGYFIGKRIVSLCEDKEYQDDEFSFEPELQSECSVSIPYYSRLPKITVVGSINIDNIIYLDEFPKSGNTEIASEVITMVGGKALNQAIGVSLLKKDVTIVGKVGKDNEAAIVRKQLTDNGVDISNLISTGEVETGKAFITINSTGESIITVAKGANSNLSVDDIKQVSRAFDNAGICLLQSEIPMPVINEAAKIAKKHNSITIFKPSTIRSMKDSDYKNIDIFVPNRNESLSLSGEKTVEKAADYFYSKGVDNVIITLDKDGALLKNKDGIKYFKTNEIRVIDATGGSDAFISALACQLLEGKDIEFAIKAANIAAGYCVSKFGASNSMIDYETLQRSINQSHINID